MSEWSPRLKRRGSIEGNKYFFDAANFYMSPRLKRRGSIEGIFPWPVLLMGWRVSTPEKAWLH